MSDRVQDLIRPCSTVIQKKLPLSHTDHPTLPPGIYNNICFMTIQRVVRRKGGIIGSNVGGGYLDCELEIYGMGYTLEHNVVYRAIVDMCSMASGVVLNKGVNSLFIRCPMVLEGNQVVALVNDKKIFRYDVIYFKIRENQMISNLLIHKNIDCDPVDPDSL